MESNQSETSIPPKISNLLNYNQELVECVLKNLKLKNLATASLVCKLWNSVANKLKVDTSVQISVNGYADVKSETYFKKATVKPENIKPEFCLTFIDYGVYDRHWYFLEKISGSRKEMNKLEKYKKSHVHQQLKNSLPSNCSSMLLTRPSAAIKYYDCTPNPQETLIGYVSLGFPVIPGVTIQPFELDADEKRTDLITTANIDHSKPLKCLILFAKSEQCESRIKKLILDIQSKQTNQFIYGIFMMHPLYKLNDKKHELDFIKGIAFSGENVNVSTVILPSNDSMIENCILNLKNPEFPCFRHNSVAFLFHKRRGDIPQVMEAFKRHFPRTVLASMQCEDLCRLEASGDNVMGFVSLANLMDTVEGMPYDSPAQIILLSWS